MNLTTPFPLPCPALALVALILPSLSLTAQGGVDFENDIRPILKTKCFKCHGGPRAKKDFRMDVVEKFQEHIGPDAYIVPGNPSESEVIRRVSMMPLDNPDRMPPPGRAEALSEAEVELMTRWIAEGASFEPGGAAGAPGAPGAPMVAEAAPDPDEIHTWISTSGTVIEAFFVSATEEGVVLRSREGQEKEFPLNLFSAESVALARQLALAPVP